MQEREHPNDGDSHLYAADEPDPRWATVDLERIPQELWEQALRPLHRQQRTFLAMQLSDETLRSAAMELAFEMDMAESERAIARVEARHRARRTAAPLPTPTATHASAKASVQLNIRLRRDDHARLARAAAAVGLRPATLARALVLNGAAQILRDQPQA
jgi:hypothetical protein